MNSEPTLLTHEIVCTLQGLIGLTRKGSRQPGLIAASSDELITHSRKPQSDLYRSRYKLYRSPEGGGEGADRAPPVLVCCNGESQLILVEDDEEPICVTAKSRLESHGYRVLTANSGRAALKLIKELPGKFQPVVTDVAPPGMGGIVLAR